MIANTMRRELGVLAVALGLVAACSSSGGGGPSGDGGTDAIEEGASSGASSGGSSGSASSSGSGGSGSSSGTAGSSSGSGGGSGGGGADCQPGMGDWCMCFPGSSNYPPNSTPCSTSDLKDPGTCCADPGWPSSGDCICSAFLCYVNQGGGRDCWYQDLGGNGAEVPTTSATGAACCTWGTASSGYICSCYSDPSLCDGKTPVSSCTMGTLPPCSSDVTVGYSQVPSCR